MTRLTEAQVRGAGCQFRNRGNGCLLKNDATAATQEGSVEIHADASPVPVQKGMRNGCGKGRGNGRRCGAGALGKQ